MSFFGHINIVYYDFGIKEQFSLFSSYPSYIVRRKTTSEHTVIQMFSSVDNITWVRTEQRKTVSLSKIIVNNINMTKKLIKTENN